MRYSELDPGDERGRSPTSAAAPAIALPVGPAALLALQRRAGNRATVALLASHHVIRRDDDDDGPRPMDETPDEDSLTKLLGRLAPGAGGGGGSLSALAATPLPGEAPGSTPPGDHVGPTYSLAHLAATPGPAPTPPTPPGGGGPPDSGASSASSSTPPGHGPLDLAPPAHRTGAELLAAGTAPGEARSTSGTKRGRDVAETLTPAPGAGSGSSSSSSPPPTWPFALEPVIFKMLRHRLAVEATIQTPPSRSRRHVTDEQQERFDRQYKSFVYDVRSHGTLYIPSPDDGTAETATTAGGPTMIQLLQERPRFPGSPLEGPISNEVVYRSKHFKYVVELFRPTTWPAPGSPPPEPLGPALRISHVTGGGGRSAVGRSYRRDQHYVVSPDVDPVLAQRIHARLEGYDYVHRGAPPDPKNWQLLDAPPEQTVRVWVRPAELARQPGQATDPGVNRRTNLVTAFPEIWRNHEGLLTGLEQTETPRVGRAEAGRLPGDVYKAFGPASTAGVAVLDRDRNPGDLSTHEFCHLIGDGDGGACDYLNLVVGTNPANTEQLAMESTLRMYRARAEALGWWVSIRVQMAAARVGKESADDDPTPGVRVGLAAQYTIQLTPMLGGGRPIPILDQFLDMGRGVIPAAEVAALEEVVKHQFERCLATLMPPKGGARAPEAMAGTKAKGATIPTMASGAERWAAGAQAPVLAPRTPASSSSSSSSLSSLPSGPKTRASARHGGPHP